MTKMVSETLVRYKCPKCLYITFRKPLDGDCPNCSFGKELFGDVVPKKLLIKKKRIRRK